MKAKPYPPRAEKERLWNAVQAALTKFLPVWFAEDYRKMEILKMKQKLLHRVIAVEGQIQRERLKRLRTKSGLEHMRRVNAGVARRMKSAAR